MATRAGESFLDVGAGFVSSKHDLLPHTWSLLKSPVGMGCQAPRFSEEQEFSLAVVEGGLASC